MNRQLLLCGVLAGPIYLTAGVAQGLLREGFSFARHPLSVLANGPLGWIQTANFLLCGLLVIAAAAGISRVLGKGSRGLTWALTGYGAGMIAASIFPADPVDGFPPGTPPGFPTSISTTGLVHFVSGAWTFLCLALSGLFGAWTFWRRGMPSLAALSLTSGLIVFLGFFGGILLPFGIVGIWAAVFVGWAWVGYVSRHLAVRANVP
jgi:hypothetical protein